MLYRYIIIKCWPFMLNFLPTLLLSNTQNIAHYAQYYTHNYSNYIYTTVHTQFIILIAKLT